MRELRLRRLPYVGREVESGTTMAPEARLAESLRGYGDWRVLSIVRIASCARAVYNT